MPISCEVSSKKTKSKTQIICESMSKIIDQAKKQLSVFSGIKKELGYEPGLFKEAASKGILKKEDARAVLSEQKAWKTEIKSDIKADLMAEKHRQKALRKTKRKGIQQLQKKAPPKRRRAPGKFI